jgi:LysR family transcriptional regulator, glycine cleavage system transcriptional activator
MDADRLPALSAVRVFEAAARLHSFTRAAQELHMTQAAVSYQVKQLELHVGGPVFRRLPRGVALSDLGERLAPAVIGAFRSMRVAFGQVGDRAEHELAISTLPAIGAGWLVPRLGAIQLANPQLSVRLDAAIRTVDFELDPFDVALRSGAGGWPGLEAHRLFPRELVPLCSPRMPIPASPRAFLDQRLLGPPYVWKRWFAAAGLPDVDLGNRTGVEYDLDQFHIATAVEGHGIAIASADLFSRELETGRLVRASDIVYADAKGYWLVYPTARRLVRKIVAFRTWILAEAKAQRDRGVSPRTASPSSRARSSRPPARRPRPRPPAGSRS